VHHGAELEERAQGGEEPAECGQLAPEAVEVVGGAQRVEATARKHLAHHGRSPYGADDVAQLEQGDVVPVLRLGDGAHG
jgi:hypothetical protein